MGQMGLLGLMGLLEEQEPSLWPHFRVRQGRETHAERGHSAFRIPNLLSLKSDGRARFRLRHFDRRLP